ncbi:MAG TPA: SOS response-associated peptidase [Cyclobacteriaceae bacterium]|nr:SOS response-associated peptidase [Cyclobacteriaceae bacterium]
MCYHKQDKALAAALVKRYDVPLPFDYTPVHYENGFDFKSSPVITAEKPTEFQAINWGLIPWWSKSKNDAEQIRMRTLNAISEEIYEKSSFRDSINNGKRCLIPCTGFFEWRWFNGGKTKYPYYIHLKEGKIFSIAGLYSNWVDKVSGEEIVTYSVLTTKANELMEKIHNSKKRMPVILPMEHEKDWLNPNLTKEDVLELCQPLPNDKLEAYTISKMITDRKVEDKNVPELFRPFEYPELALLDS